MLIRKEIGIISNLTVSLNSMTYSIYDTLAFNVEENIFKYVERKVSNSSV